VRGRKGESERKESGPVGLHGDCRRRSWQEGRSGTAKAARRQRLFRGRKGRRKRKNEREYRLPLRKQGRLFLKMKNEE